MSMSCLGRLLVSVVVAGALAANWLPASAAAAAPTDQLALFQEDSGLFSDPAATLRTLRSLGVGAVRVSLRWNELAPAPNARRRPRAFIAANPAAYGAKAWRRYDRIVEDAQADGIAVDVVLSGSGPLWASGAGAPRDKAYGQWRPSAREYEQFVQAIATRYSGRYRRCGSCSTLPPVRFWEIWNEPNFGQDLAPQAIDGSTVSTSPGIYRGLVNAGWAALQRTGHGHDTILIGGLSPRGFQGPPSPRFRQGLPGFFATTAPLRFVRTLYCADASFRALRGRAARAVGCPTTAAASRRFRSANRGLFDASGFGIHPYPYNLPPTRADSPDPSYVEFNEIPRLASALDRLQRIHGSRRRLQIYNTEYGYITNPPNRSNHFVSPATAGYYSNWAEYLSWRSPRIATTMQFLLYDPNPTLRGGAPEFGGFASGLMFYGRKPKATYYAYRMPLFLPISSTRRGRALEVWGCVRPANYAKTDTHGSPQRVQIEFRQGARGSFRTIKTVLITDVHGYFDVHVTFPSSGAVRLSWAYPPTDRNLTPSYTDSSRPNTIHSRVAPVTVS
jgi:hypothetical protein